MGELSGTPTFWGRNEGWAVGEGPALLHTMDGGRTWKRVKISIDNTDTNSEIRGTYFISAQTAWIGLRQLKDRLAETPALAVTHDGGLTWKAESLPNIDWFLESLFGTDERDGPLWLGGQAAHKGNAPVEDMDCPQRVLGFTWTPAIYFRPAPGLAWKEQALPVHNGCPVSIIRFLDKARGVAIAGSAIMFSDDEGTHWRQSVIRSSTKIRPPTSMQFRGLEGWTGSDNGEILHTSDGGEDWDEIVAPGTIWSKARGFGSWGAVCFTSAEKGFTLGGMGELFETDDRGMTWSKVSTPKGIVHLGCAEDQCWLASSDTLYRIEIAK